MFYKVYFILLCLVRVLDDVWIVFQISIYTAANMEQGIKYNYPIKEKFDRTRVSAERFIQVITSNNKRLTILQATTALEPVGSRATTLSQ
ncbi:uncharacterized protein LOC111050373 [Nilaparvata lugens]|uniref:uncharacterized protein LOC111050373 n=1 Tax=Nilaparvata lugens TaxID=108931 RepID=UPI00193E4AFF|nr:uncharacterized protein LOC111050373 [Nilaparvata lugens]